MNCIAVYSFHRADVCPSFNIFPRVESPTVSVAFSEILIGIGEPTVMACSASGIPQPEIWWYKGNILEEEMVSEKKQKKERI